MDYSSLNQDIKDLILFNEIVLKSCQSESLRKIPAMSFRVLCILKKNNGCNINFLSKVLNISKQQTSVVIKRLEETHYINVVKDTNDKRKTCVFLTDEANELADKHLDSISRDFTSLLSTISEDKRVELVQRIHELTQCIERCKEDI